MIFVDTGAWFALVVPTDANYEKAQTIRDAHPDDWVTSDYVLDELLTLLKARGETVRAWKLGKSILEESACRLEFIAPFDVRAAWVEFSKFRDKGWSFTDCVSRALMDRLGITTAFAFDRHFQQFGDITVLS